MNRHILLGLIAALTFPVHSVARQPELPLGQDTVTIYLDTDFGSRKKRAARMLSKSHREFAEKGYRFVDLQIYIEDGDQEGFFVTYTRVKTKPSPNGE